MLCVEKYNGINQCWTAWSQVSVSQLHGNQSRRTKQLGETIATFWALPYDIIIGYLLFRFRFKVPFKPDGDSLTSSYLSGCRMPNRQFSGHCQTCSTHATIKSLDNQMKAYHCFLVPPAGYECGGLSFCLCAHNKLQKMTTMKRCVPLIPGCGVRCDFEATRVANKFIQNADDLFKLRPVVPLFLPAVQHQLVEGSGAVHGWGEAVTLIYSLYYLHVGGKRFEKCQIEYVQHQEDILSAHLELHLFFPFRIYCKCLITHFKILIYIQDLLR